ncbi:hypothetical protein Bxe_B3034 [Paraburkholderia xenovorans LB400]|uniref:Uncharacterized protein n=1 Tax=Paraburkholderia xenovorans (strain LB400) TaxID=266265 RepID=Q13PV4_PARXL|nr:hypothetical protein Bxe_B3034 [Paraburkholderia xenovorans LB400]
MFSPTARREAAQLVIDRSGDLFNPFSSHSAARAVRVGVNRCRGSRLCRRQSIRRKTFFCNASLLARNQSRCVSGSAASIENDRLEPVTG